MTTIDFNDKLSSMVSLEMTSGTVHNPEKMAALIESLASALAFTVALSARGEAKAINHVLEGMVAYIYQVAAEKAPIASMIANSPRPS